jgi:lipopolysaccharide transport protein LptA
MFRINALAQGKPGIVNGQALQITYLRRLNLIRLENNAQLDWGENLIQGQKIEFDTEANTFSAGGEQGVRIFVPPGE